MLRLPIANRGECMRARSNKLGRSVEAVAHPRLRRDVFGMLRIRLDLLPQILDEDTQVIYLISVIGSPHGLQQLPMRDCLIRMLCEVPQQIEFFGRQMSRCRSVV